MKALLPCAVVMVFAACGAPRGVDDAGIVDAGSLDAGRDDAGLVDAGPPDASLPDAGGGGGGGDAGAQDAGGGSVDAGNPSRFWDGGSCMPKDDCPCFSSDDCAPTFTCRSEDMSGTRVFCEPGARGVGAVGAPCVDEASCQSALCVSGRGDAGSRCSALCETAADCAPSVPRCVFLAFADRRMCLP